MTSTQHVRIDQVAELTRAVEVPLPHVDPQIIEIILDAVAQGWEYLRQNHLGVLQNGEEAEISALLDTWLNAELSTVPGLDLIVSSVDRGRESISYDGKRLEVRPDISFRLTHQDARFRLIAECKIIDTGKGKTAGLYRDKGVARFVEGDYAWANREALMFGYVRCGSGLEKTVLKSLKNYAALNCNEIEMRASITPLIKKDALGTSTHGRSFAYVHAATTLVPGPIELWHLWLEAT